MQSVEDTQPSNSETIQTFVGNTTSNSSYLQTLVSNSMGPSVQVQKLPGNSTVVVSSSGVRGQLPTSSAGSGKISKVLFLFAMILAFISSTF